MVYGICRDSQVVKRKYCVAVLRRVSGVRVSPRVPILSGFPGFAGMVINLRKCKVSAESF